MTDRDREAFDEWWHSDQHDIEVFPSDAPALVAWKLAEASWLAATAAEREGCAKHVTDTWISEADTLEHGGIRGAVAAAIRARGGGASE